VSGTAENLSRVADKVTAIPSGSGTFATFSDPLVSGSNVAFRATGTNGQVGIYLHASGAFLRVGDTNAMMFTTLDFCELLALSRRDFRKLL
jgi:hypothetical protein